MSRSEGGRDPTRPPTAADGLRRVSIPVLRVVTTAACVAIVLVAAALQPGPTVTSAGGQVVFVVLRAWVEVGWLVAIVGFLLGAGWFAARGRAAWRPYPAALAGALVVVSVGSVAARAVTRSVVAIEGPLDAPDRRRYCVAVHRGGRFLARELPSSDAVRTGWIALAVVPDTGPVPLLVRPAARSTPAGLRLAPDGRLVDVDDDGRCRATILPGTEVHERWRDAATAALRDLSPFVLLRPEDAGSDQDLAMLIAGLRTGTRWSRALLPPSDATLLEALDSPNPWVRDAARRLVEAGGEALYPEASRRR